MLFTLRLHEKGHCWTFKIIIIKPFSLIPCCRFNEIKTNFLIINICFVHNLKYQPIPAKSLTSYRVGAIFENKININSSKQGLYFKLILNSRKSRRTENMLRLNFRKVTFYCFFLFLIYKSMCQCAKDMG